MLVICFDCVGLFCLSIISTMSFVLLDVWILLFKNVSRLYMMILKK